MCSYHQISQLSERPEQVTPSWVKPRTPIMTAPLTHSHSDHVTIQEAWAGGHWAMASPLGAEGALCDCSAPSNRECFCRENVVGGRPRTTKSPSEKSLQ